MEMQIAISSFSKPICDNFDRLSSLETSTWQTRFTTLPISSEYSWSFWKVLDVWRKSLKMSFAGLVSHSSCLRIMKASWAFLLGKYFKARMPLLCTQLIVSLHSRAQLWMALFLLYQTQIWLVLFWFSMSYKSISYIVSQRPQQGFSIAIRFFASQKSSINHWVMVHFLKLQSYMQIPVKRVRLGFTSES